MKKSTYALIALIAIGLFAAFFIPISLAFLSPRETTHILDLTDHKTVTTSVTPFRHLTVGRTDSTRLSVGIELTVECNDSISAPSLTMEGGWGKWVTLNERSDTLTLTIDISECDGHTYTICNLPGTLKVPAGMMTSLCATPGIYLSTALNGITTHKFITFGVPQLSFRSCAIDSVSIDCTGIYASMNADDSRIGQLAMILNNTQAQLHCSGTTIGDLRLYPTGNNSHLDLTEAAVGNIMYSPCSNGTATISLGANSLSGKIRNPSGI